MCKEGVQGGREGVGREGEGAASEQGCDVGKVGVVCVWGGG